MAEWNSSREAAACHDPAASREWALTVDEQDALLEILASDDRPAERSKAASKRADTLFGDLPSPASSR